MPSTKRRINDADRRAHNGQACRRGEGARALVSAYAHPSSHLIIAGITASALTLLTLSSAPASSYGCRLVKPLLKHGDWDPLLPTDVKQNYDISRENGWNDRMFSRCCVNFLRRKFSTFGGEAQKPLWPCFFAVLSRFQQKIADIVQHDKPMQLLRNRL